MQAVVSPWCLLVYHIYRHIRVMNVLDRSIKTILEQKVHEKEAVIQTTTYDLISKWKQLIWDHHNWTIFSLCPCNAIITNEKNNQLTWTAPYVHDTHWWDPPGLILERWCTSLLLAVTDASRSYKHRWHPHLVLLARLFAVKWVEDIMYKFF